MSEMNPYTFTFLKFMFYNFSVNMEFHKDVMDIIQNEDSVEKFFEICTNSMIFSDGIRKEFKLLFKNILYIAFEDMQRYTIYDWLHKTKDYDSYQFHLLGKAHSFEELAKGVK